MRGSEVQSQPELLICCCDKTQDHGNFQQKVYSVSEGKYMTILAGRMATGRQAWREW